MRVLDAGCGRNLHLSYPGLDLRNAHVTGIDVSQAVLDGNEQVDEKILGDLQSYPFEPESFDVVICQDVLEHLPQPERALRNMARALRPGGEILIAVSNPASFKGLVTKFTPHRFHVWVYKRGLFGYRYRGPDGPPFKTHMRWSIRPSQLERDLRRLGFVQISVELRDPPRLEAWWSERPRRARLLERVWPQARLSECRVRALKR